MKKKRVLGMVTALALTAVVCIGGTLAYLSAQSQTVTNTFTVGKGYIDGDDGLALKLDEEDILKDDGSRTMTGNEYKDLYPGADVVKDPTVYLTGGSVESYVFVKVTGADELEAIKAKDENGNPAQAFAIDGWGTSYWTKIAELDKSEAKSETGNGYYVANHGKTIDFSNIKEGEADYAQYFTLGAPLFTNVVMNGSLGEQPELAPIQKIDISACAVQYSADQMNSYADAFASAKFAE